MTPPVPGHGRRRVAPRPAPRTSEGDTPSWVTEGSRENASISVSGRWPPGGSHAPSGVSCVPGPPLPPREKGFLGESRTNEDRLPFFDLVQAACRTEKVKVTLTPSKAGSTEKPGSRRLAFTGRSLVDNYKQPAARAALQAGEGRQGNGQQPQGPGHQQKLSALDG